MSVVQDKSSDIEQQFGDLKYSNSLPQKRGIQNQREHHIIIFNVMKGQITISSDTSPLVGIQFLTIPFAFDFAFKMHSKKKASNSQ